ncbi:multinuclear nonheme iron-dependent oxidase [Spirosoma pulveris]
MASVFSSIDCNLDTNGLQASLPLFESEKVQAIEWSFDTLFALGELPDWFAELLRAYSQEGRLIGHGVFFSLFSGKWTPDQQQWLNQLKAISADFTFDHLTEHFGFMTGEDFHKGAPVSIPFTASTLAIGRDRLLRLQDAGNCPVGLENLAVAYSLDDVKRQGNFLSQLLEPINGFIILDLHNLYCQSQNFTIDIADIQALYPLDRVREIHISGGSWVPSAVNPTKQIRRDTHDDSVPEAVFHALEQVIGQCPNLKFVVLEQLGTGLVTEASRHRFQEDFYTMDDIVGAANRVNSPSATNTFRPLSPISMPETPTEDSLLYQQQTELSTILETATDCTQAQLFLSASSLAKSDWEIENWKPEMLETAIAIAQKWKDGFVQRPVVRDI